MSMIVHNNMSAVHTLNVLNQNNNALQKSLTKVASGMKINSAQDDASAYAISERMRVRIRSLDQANQNTQNDSALMKTAEGAVANTVEILKTLKEKAINSANDSNTDEDRQTIQKEVDQFIDQIDDNALVQFNGKYLVDGSKNYTVKKTSTSNTHINNVFLNYSLSTDSTTNTHMTALKDRAGNSLGIQIGDKWETSYVINGNVITHTGTVVSGSTGRLVYLLQEGFDSRTGNGDVGSSSIKAGDRAYYDKNLNEIISDEACIAIVGMKNKQNEELQIDGFSFSITDAQGNIKKSANAVLNDFKLVKRKENNTGDQALTFHVGSEANVAIKVALTDMRAESLGLKGNTGNKLSVTTKTNANVAINVIDNALSMALDQITTIGAVQARLEYTAANLTTSSENVQASESTIRDADMAKEMTNYTKNNVLLQSAQAMLAQANQNSSAVLGLLQ